MSNRHYQEIKCSFNLPDFTDRVIQGGTAGTYKTAGLPNIQGEINSSRVGYWDDATKSGAFSDSYKRSNGSAAGYDTNHKPIVVVFKASSSNSIYGNSNTVQPPALCVNVCIKY